MATKLKITAKGQVTLKKAILDSLGVKPGDELVVTTGPGPKVELHKAVKTGGRIEDMFGRHYDPNRPAFTIEEINEATAKAWAGEL
jgi:AbrB family looped-hinge helix DNA binding protein